MTLLRFPGRRGPGRTALASAALAALAGFPATHAATLVVNNSGDDGNPTCDSQTCNLRAAIQAANSGDEIVFSPNLPYPLTIRLAAALGIGKNLVIQHPQPGAVTLDAGAGQPGHRVLEITNQADVRISGLRLTGGRVSGTDGTNGAGPGAAGATGGNGGGGCVWVAQAARLTLQSVVVRGCESRGGRGGNGAAGRAGQAGTVGAYQQNGRDGENGGLGGAGGTGGLGLGGGLLTDGDLILLDSSVVSNTTRAGFGGNGGAGGKGGRGGNGGPGGGSGTGGNGGQGGDGGNGGAGGGGGEGIGGGVTVGWTGTVQAVNTLIADNRAFGESNGDPGIAGEAGTGGNGGVGGEQGEPGADGVAGTVGARARPGSGTGGGLSTNGASNAGLLSFVSVVKNFAGPGATTATSSADGVARAGGLGYFGAIGLRNSILADNTIHPAVASNCYLVPPAQISGSNFSTTPACNVNAVDARSGVVYDDSGAMPLARLEPDSPAVDLVADCTVQANGILNTMDQRGAARPQDGDGDGNAHCDIGAYEADGIASERIFRSGFE